MKNILKFMITLATIITITGCNKIATGNGDDSDTHVTTQILSYSEYFLKERPVEDVTDNLFPDYYFFFISRRKFSTNYTPSPYIQGKVSLAKSNSEGVYLYNGINKESTSIYSGDVIFGKVDDTTYYFIAKEEDLYAVYSVTLDNTLTKICEYSMTLYREEIETQTLGIFLYKNIMFFANEDELYRLYLPDGTFELIYKDDENIFKRLLTLIMPLTNYSFYEGTDGGIRTYPMVFYSTKTNTAYYATEEEADLYYSEYDTRSLLNGFLDFLRENNTE